MTEVPRHLLQAWWREVPSLRALASAAGALAVVAGSLGAGSSVAVAADTCPNAAVRAQQHAEHLPDCRAYERVTVNKSGSAWVSPYALRDDVAVWESLGAPAPAGSGSTVAMRSSRVDGRWITEDRAAIPEPRGTSAVGTMFFNAGLSARWWMAESPEHMQGSDIWRQVDGEPAHRVGPGQDLWAAGARAVRVSDDGHEAVVQTPKTLTPSDTDGGGMSLYLIDANDTPHLLTAKADGTSIDSCGAGVPADNVGASREGTVSKDLQTVFFATGSCTDNQGVFSPPRLYARRSAATTVAVAPSQRTTPDPAGPRDRQFLQADPSGRLVLLQTAEQLLDEDTDQDPDLYRYDLLSHRLELVSRGSDPTAGANVGEFLRASDDVSIVYFVATGALAPGAVVGEPNLYVNDHGHVRIVTTLDASESSGVMADVTRAGGRLVFQTVAALSPQDVDTSSDIYGYDLASGELRLLSGDGAQPAVLTPRFLSRGGNDGSRQGSGVAAVMSEDGGLGTFGTDDALDPADHNGTSDAYRWSWSKHDVQLVSSGSAGGLVFGSFALGDYPAGISASGKTIMIGTYAPLVASDTDQSDDLYVARVDGGVVEPEEAPARTCDGDACQGDASVARHIEPAGSIAFDGVGNVAAPKATAMPSVKVARLSTVKGTRAVLSVKVPAAGSVRASGARVRTTSVSVKSARAVRVGVQLTATAARQLTRSGRMRVAVRVRFVTATGRAAETTVTLTFARPAKKGGR